jgi:eukaryotic-like serine/threonine-protein kinase
MELTPGAVIAGRYRVDYKVGAGGMGEVWAGEHSAVGTKVAIKALLLGAALNPEIVARFKREAYILGRIRSDHVARVVDFVADQEYGLILVMEFIEGDSLASVLATGPLTVEETIEIGVDIASALVDLHESNIVHRDLKPGNIILQPVHGERRRRAVVVDFGVSRLNSTGGPDDDEITGITRADMAVGTIEYMAPEQILNSRNVTSASDVYATGAILFRAVAGRHVFGNITSDTALAQKKLTTDPPGLPLLRTDALAVGLGMVVSRALKRRPSERYKTAPQLLSDLLPLRDLGRVGQLEMDSATIDHKPLLEAMLAGAAAATPLAASPQGQGPAASALTAQPSAAFAAPPAKVSSGPAPTAGSTPPFAPEAGSRAALPPAVERLPRLQPSPTRRIVSVLVAATLLAVATFVAMRTGVLRGLTRSLRGASATSGAAAPASAAAGAPAAMVTASARPAP